MYWCVVQYLYLKCTFEQFRNVRDGLTSYVMSFRSPRKWETFIQCWCNVGPPSQTMDQHWASLCQCLQFGVTWIADLECVSMGGGGRYVGGSWKAVCLCGWNCIEVRLLQTSTRRRPSATVCDAGPTLRQHWASMSCGLVCKSHWNRDIDPALVQIFWHQAPMACSFRLWLGSQKYWVRIPVGSDVCHRGSAYTMLQNFQRPGVYIAVYGSVHYKKNWSFDKSRASFCRHITMIVQKAT